MSEKILECVPNFSEGRDKRVIEAIANSISSVSGVKLLDVDSGAAANRTVYTFAGEPQAVVEAAFNAIRVGTEMIDMRRHRGTHPRIGAADVVPLVPLKGISIEEAVELAHKLGQRVGQELGIPVYMYEFAATKPERRNLAVIRAGEYENLPKKMSDPNWTPDYGPKQWSEKVAKTGATVIGARKLLVAFNVNLNTKNVEIAKKIAKQIRESGYKRSGERVPGLLRKVKAIGWYIDEFKRAQVSMNLVDVDVTPLHVVFDTVEYVARKYGVRVTGSELVGLIPKRILLETGKFYLRKQNLEVDLTEEELLDIAIMSLGLNDVKNFEPQKKILDFLLKTEI